MQLSLYFLTEVQLADSILLALLLVGMPALAIAQLPLIKEAFIERVPAYWSSIGTLCALGVITCLVGMRREGPRAIGLEWISTDRLVIWTLVLTVAGLVVSFAFRNIGISLGLKESRMLRALLPETGKERGIFVLLSVAAGLGEEIAYRGYAIPVLTPVCGLNYISRFRGDARVSKRARYRPDNDDGSDTGLGFPNVWKPTPLHPCSHVH